MTTATLTNPPDIAKEAIRQLALRRMVPTPENYARLYSEVAGVAQAEARPAPAGPNAGAWSDLLRGFLRAWDSSIPGFTQAKKRESITRLLDRQSPSAEVLHARFSRLMKSWRELGPDQVLQTGQPVSYTDQMAPRSGDGSAPIRDRGATDAAKGAETVHEKKMAIIDAAQPDTSPTGIAVARNKRTPPLLVSVPRREREDAPRILRGLLAGALENAVSADLGYSPEQVALALELTAELRDPQRGSDLEGLAVKCDQLWKSLELHGAGQQEVVTGLTLLLQLLLSNIAELTTDDRWLKGQLEKLRVLVSGPMNVHALVDAHRGMREVIARQGTLKHSLDEARQALKSMLASFIDRLGAMTVNTGEFQGKIEGYVARIEATDDLARLSEIVRELLSDTRGMQGDIVRTHGDLQAAKQRAEVYEVKVRDLETKLEQVSGLVCEDPLTSALNRRGLDEAFQKESARCDRTGSPLCVAVLDLDNFKNLNDRLGHQAGDFALVHLVDVVREAIRPTDILGRFGGEEFVILLPDTSPEAAEVATVRVQRALTRRFFMHNNERVLITFSAGVARLETGDTWNSVLDRADRALYEAKRLGKNRVVLATPSSGSQVHSG